MLLLKPGGEEIDRTFDYVRTAEFTSTIDGYHKGIGTLKTMLADEKSNEKNAEFLYKLGEKLYSHSRMDDADTRFATVVTLDPEDKSGKADDAQLYRAAVCRRKEDWNCAIAQARDVIKRWPKGEMVDDATIYIAWYSSKAGLKDQAIATFNEYLTKWPKGEDVDFAKEQLKELQAAPSTEGGGSN